MSRSSNEAASRKILSFLEPETRWRESYDEALNRYLGVTEFRTPRIDSLGRIQVSELEAEFIACGGVDPGNLHPQEQLWWDSFRLCRDILNSEASWELKYRQTCEVKGNTRALAAGIRVHYRLGATRAQAGSRFHDQEGQGPSISEGDPSA